jgi:hypothetical protein
MPVSVDDRRLTNRVLAKWTVITAGQRMPRRAEITPEAFGDDWRYCSLIALDPTVIRSRLAYVGEIMQVPDRKSGTDQILNDYAEGTLLRLAAAKIPAMIAKRGPITFGGTGAHDGKAMLYRAILLPMSEDNNNIDHVLSAINYRDISAAQEMSLDEPTGEAVPQPPQPKPDPVSSYIAFSSRRMSFAPSVAKRPPSITVR